MILPGFSRMWCSFRHSKSLVIAVVFIVMMLDLIMLTTLEPILPDIIYGLHFEPLANTTGRLTSSNITNGTYTIAMHRQENLMQTTRYTGVVLSTKQGTEVIANIIVGYIVERYGHRYPMFIGCVGNMLAILGFAYGPTVNSLIAARVVQAFSSSLSVVSGLALLSTVFRDEQERSRATGIAFGGLSVGIILGFPLGTTLYQFSGRATPFLLLAALNIVDGFLRLAVITPKEDDKRSQRRANQCLQVSTDPYILIALGANLIISAGLGIVVATEAAWILNTFQVGQWKLGMVLMSGAVMQFIAQFLIGSFVQPDGRWKYCMIAMWLSAAAYIAYPFSPSIWWVIGPEVMARTGLGIFYAVISPLLSYIVDKRHDGNYGIIYGLYAASYNLGLTIGPISGGIFLHVVTFKRLYWSAACAIFVSSFFCIILRQLNEPETLDDDEKQPLIKENPKTDTKGDATIYSTT